MLSPGPPQFRTTRWSLVARTRGSHPDRAAALETLCGTYWRPLYAFLRRDGHPPEEAEDLVQGLLADLLERDDFAVADPERGRFRTFLLAALKNYRSKWREKADAVKRGGRMTRRPLDFGAAEIATTLGSTPGTVKAAAARRRRDFRAELDAALADGLDGADAAAERATLFAALAR